ncbi:DNA-3-methyladenine glycosylase I [Ruminococcus sp. Marseille-P6503]|uniref:DNA-3-methyladenine glycosylase I n=1 Tax=Ruminococcus sp. Marseille-P6503 TaxID=2364796 RepID=UPI000F546D9A|nr:DNA-3-methyladenine glycosylase I [Ruminococcus sp. Marseille-P6503]
MENAKRCGWCRDNGLMQKYHDEEWGEPVHDDRKQFEFLMMEVMQCGLNWSLMLKKREIFRRCFDNFDYEKTALYGETQINDILNTPDMIRSERKIRAIINNANMFLKIRQEFGSFDKYLWGFSDNKTIVYKAHADEGVPASNELSDRISVDLKKRGFKYLGSITVYSHLQACGIINDHCTECFRYGQLIGKDNVIIK